MQQTAGATNLERRKILLGAAGVVMLGASTALHNIFQIDFNLDEFAEASRQLMSVEREPSAAARQNLLIKQHPRLEDAIRVVRANPDAISISLLQRHLLMGYHAARALMHELISHRAIRINKNKINGINYYLNNSN